METVEQGNLIARIMALLRSFAFLFTVLTIIVVSYGQNDYCNICRDHTMCRFTVSLYKKDENYKKINNAVFFI